MIIGFCGAAGAGKDTAAAALIDQLLYGKVSFAEPLKMVLNYIFGWVMSDWDRLEWKEAPNPNCWGFSPREMAQTLGTDWGRNTVNEDIWVQAAMRLHQQNKDFLGDRIVFTDVRFPNEARAIRKAGGVLIYVTCRDRATGTDSNQHESEQYLPWLHVFADCEISADLGEIEALGEAAINTVTNYLSGRVPRFKPDSATLAQLDTLEEDIRGQYI